MKELDLANKLLKDDDKRDPVLQVVNIDDIEVGERFRQELGNLNELVHSYKKHGFFSVIALGKNPEGSAKPYRLLCGGRRLEACKLRGMKTVNATVYDRELTELELREIELDENIYRKDLTWQENAELTAQIHELQTAIHGKKTSTSPNAPGWSQAQTALKMGKSIGAVSQALALSEGMKLIPELAKCKTADEAKKMLENIGKKIKAEEIAKKHTVNNSGNGSLAKIKSDLCDRYILGDFFSGIQRVPDNSQDIVEIDPPYGIDLNTGKKRDSYNHDIKLQEYNEVDRDQYPIFVSKVVDEAYRILKPTGWMIFWFAHEPWFETVFQIIMSRKFLGNRMVGIWKKSAGQAKRPELYLANVTEMFFYARKSTGYIHKARSNVFDFPSVNPSKKIHPTERPIELMMEILSTFGTPGSNVCVPFLGSGNTLLAAANLGMTGIGWDLTKQYKDHYVIRVYEGEPGKYTSYPNIDAIGGPNG